MPPQIGYLILLAALLVSVVLILRTVNKRRLTKKREALRSQWGKPKSVPFEFDRIKKYSDLSQGDPFHRLTEQTIEDIDFYSLFSFIDRTTSRVGQQVLYAKVVQPTDQLHNPLDPFIDAFKKDERLREEVQFELVKLNHTDAYHIASLMGGDLLKRPKWLWAIYLNLALLLVLALLSFSYPFCIILMIVPFTANMLVHYWNKGNTYQFIRSFPQLNVLIQVSNALLKRGKLFSNAQAIEAIGSLRSFQRKSRFISLSGNDGLGAELSQIGLYFVELIKIFFLVEVISLFRIIHELEKKREAISELFTYVGNIDLAISILSLRAGSLKTCQPNLTDSKKRIIARGIFHPLIEACVKNDLTIDGKSVLITGSNMSGKSTFLRTLTINSILAQTIYTCFADEFVSPPIKQFSSIRIDDNLFQGKSYYFQEVKIMASLLTEAESSHQNLFVLDEVFKGTNTAERIGAAKAILSYLNRKDNIVIVSTHDIELAEMLSSEYDLHHFTETVESKELHFDHTLKPGPLTTRNAIKLLELANYPKEVIDEAKKVSNGLLKH